MKSLFPLISILLFLTTDIFAQPNSPEYEKYWKANFEADKHYNNEEYHKAAKAFEVLWAQKSPYNEEIAGNRLRAAAANCMIDNEEGVRKNLFKIIDVATKTDRKRVLVNYQIFNKYKGKDLSLIHI